MAPTSSSLIDPDHVVHVLHGARDYEAILFPDEAGTGRARLTRLISLIAPSRLNR